MDPHVLECWSVGVLDCWTVGVLKITKGVGPRKKPNAGLGCQESWGVGTC
jgi:hypothetical protein